jgi:hypothetical protein
MPTLVLFHEFGKYLGDGTIDLDTHTFKGMLSNTAPTQGTNTVKADITEISAGNGYSAGGATLGSVTWAETGSGTGVWRFDSADIAFTASGGAIATHRYLVIYDDTPTSPADPLVGYVDRGSSADISDGSTRTWTTASGLFDLTVP